MSKKVLNQFLFGGAGAATPAGELGLLIFRAGAGLGLALLHGITKLPVKPELVEHVARQGFPAPTVSAWMAALGEVVGGLLLAFGLFTRPAALWIMAVMGGAAFVVHGRSFSGEAPLRDAELALLYLAAALCFLLTGSGRTGLDRFFRRPTGRSGPRAPQ